MLKIKDNVDLKELQKYGWTYYTDKTCNYYGCCLKTDKQIDWFINGGRYISMFEKNNKSAFDLDTIYDLIKADLVEKVSNNE